MLEEGEQCIVEGECWLASGLGLGQERRSKYRRASSEEDRNLKIHVSASKSKHEVKFSALEISDGEACISLQSANGSGSRARKPLLRLWVRVWLL
jgi:hypothetical protein